jgi:hypothetical protein
MWSQMFYPQVINLAILASPHHTLECGQHIQPHSSHILTVFLEVAPFLLRKNGNIFLKAGKLISKQIMGLSLANVPPSCNQLTLHSSSLIIHVSNLKAHALFT